MAGINFDYHPQFFTATIPEWKYLLAADAYKDIIIQSLRFLVKEKSIVVYAFVIMPNHMHLIWQIQDGFKLNNIQMRFLKFTAQQFKFRLTDTKDAMLNKFEVNATDRCFQFWERNSLNIDLWGPAVFDQKLDYIPACRRAGTTILYRKNGAWQNTPEIISIHRPCSIKQVLMTSAS